ncbi:tetratricopeptide repeat protein [Chryseobacterium sp.]|uniref:tetratricopeptide repeat protein n=1 Tax=Chryseobacterium sp. TaxID=1871047 RepID=UPI0023F4CEC4|nr:tetratricopeptide repeat protein [Chryseobacterium sp.]
MPNTTNKQVRNWFIDQLNLYQSANSDFESIKRNFIIREAEFIIITQSLLNKDSNDPLQHELILGRRGSGKSTLLKRIEIEITENKKLSKKYIPINLAEEQAGIYRLFDLWEQVIEELQHQLKIIQNKKDFEDFETAQDYTRHLYDLIHTICIKNKKRIVLLLDNFDRIVENFTDDGNLLRETLINYNDIEIIAGSTRMDEHFWKYDMPFYEFFRKHKLEALSREEMLLLLNHWAKSLDITELKDFIKNNPGKLENIRILTDGLPRTLQFFIQIVLQNSQAYGYDYLKKIMDHVTPLYQERLNHLPPQLRKIVLEMSFIWEACTTKQLVEKTRMESKLISANLKTLVQKGIVDKIETSKKNHLYRISERFFNMWLIFTQGNPEQKRKAKCLSVFLENWYDYQDFKTLAENHISQLREKKINFNEAIILSKALSQAKYISLEQRDLILDLTETINENKIKDTLIHLPKKAKEILNEIIETLEKRDYKKSIKLISSIENEEDGLKFYLLGVLYSEENSYIDAEKYYLLAIEKGENKAINDLATLYKKQNKPELAEKYYLLAIENKEYRALNNLAILYRNQNKLELAEKYYLQAIEKGEKKALNNLAVLYKNQNKLELAEKYYLQAIAGGSDNAIFNLANLYKKQKRYSDAETYYLKAIKKGNNDAIINLANLYYVQKNYLKTEKYYLLAIKKGDYIASNNLALLYSEQKKYKEAEKYYLLAIEKYNSKKALFNIALLYEKQSNYKKAEKYYLLAIENNITEAINNLAMLYQDQDRYKEAENYYLLAIKKGMYKSFNNLANLYAKQGNYQKAEEYYLSAIKKEDFIALNNLGMLYEEQQKYDKAEEYYLLAIGKNIHLALNNLAMLYEEQQKYDKAEEYYKAAIKENDDNALNNLAILYYNQNINKEQVLKLLIKNNKNPQNLIIAEIWNGLFKDLEKRVFSLVRNGNVELQSFIIDLLIHQQKNLVLKLFKSPDLGLILKEKYTVLYYVCMLINNHNEENLELKTPPEIENTIREILQIISTKEKFYGYIK